MQNDYRRRILTVQLHIQDHLDGELTVEELARVAALSPFHFHRIFRAMVGETVAEYVRRLRLESAAFRLRTDGEDIVDIALGAGYSSHEAFTRAFRKRFGIAPTRFRSDQPIVEKEDSLTTHTLNEVRIEERAPMKVAFLRHLGPYEECGPVFEKLVGWAGRSGRLQGNPVMLGISHDDPDVVEADKIRFDCCLVVEDDFQSEGEIESQTLEGGSYAVLCHRGPYKELHETYRWLFGVWLPTSGRRVRHAPPFEVYRKNPETTPPEELETDIYIPLEE